MQTSPLRNFQKEKNKTVQNQSSFTEGKILSPLLRFAVPVLLAMFLQAMYGAVDLLIVGKFASTSDISAVATGSQLMATVTFAVQALSMGITVLLGQRIGEGNEREASKTLGNGLTLFAFIAVLMTALMLLLTNILIATLEVPEAALSAARNYVRICSGGSVFIIAFNLLGSIFRALGDSRLPLLTVAIACIINIAGDLLLVAGFHMGSRGAAIATVAAQGISVLISFFVIRRRGLSFRFDRRDLRPHRETTWHILKIGVPMALQDVLVSVSFLVILAIVNAIGLTESAGAGVAEKLCAFVMLIPSAFMQSMSAFVAQNIGAGKPERAEKALRYGIMVSLGVGLLVGGVTFFRGDLLAGLFANERDVILAAWDYLKAYAIDTLLTSFLFCFIGYYSGLGKTFFVMLQGIVGAFCVRIPAAWLFSRLFPGSLFHVALATPCSTLVQIALCLLYFRRVRQSV